MTDTTSTEENSSGGMVCPFSGKYLSAARVKELDERRERVRQQVVAEYSLSPLYQAKALSDPEFWNKFGCMGRV